MSNQLLGALRQPFISSSPATSETGSAPPDLTGFFECFFAEAGQMAGQIDSDSPLTRNYETAFELLARATDGLELLVSRNHELENQLRLQKEQTSAEIAAIVGIAGRWQQLAAALKIHLEESERCAEDLRQRLEVADLKFAEAEERLVRTEKRAVAEAKLTVLFHDRIIAAFGIGSACHTTLDSVAQGRLNERDPYKR